MAKEKKENISSVVYKMISEKVDALGYNIWDVDYHKEGSENDLEIIIENKDPEKRIGLEDCEKVSRLVSPMLDENDPIPENYCLEVSSAGLERTLKKEWHFEFCRGWEITVSFFTAIDGKKKICGKLLSFSDGTIEVETEDGTFTVEKGKYSRVVAFEPETV